MNPSAGLLGDELRGLLSRLERLVDPRGVVESVGEQVGRRGNVSLVKSPASRCRSQCWSRSG